MFKTLIIVLKIWIGKGSIVIIKFLSFHGIKDKLLALLMSNFTICTSPRRPSKLSRLYDKSE